MKKRVKINFFEGRGLTLWFHMELPCVDFKDTQFLIIWWNLELDIVEILKVGHFKSQHFFVYCWIKNLSNHVKSGAQEHSGALKSNDHSWHDGIVPISAHGWSCLCMSAMSTHECSCPLMSNHRRLWALITWYKEPRVAMMSHEHSGAWCHSA